MENYRVGVYCRAVDSKIDEKEITVGSVGAQHDMLTHFVVAQGWHIKDSYIDDGYSNASVDRPAYKRMMADIEGGSLDCVVVTDCSRLWAGDGVAQWAQDVCNLGVRLIAICEQSDTHEDDAAAPSWSV